MNPVSAPRIGTPAARPGGGTRRQALVALGHQDVDPAGVTVGAPTVAGAVVTAEVAAEVRGPKLITRKKRQRQTYRRTIGHRQDLMEVKITAISADGEKKKATRKKAAPKADAAEAATEA